MKNFNPNYFGAPVLEKKYNDNHGPDGRFAGADGGSGSVTPSGSGNKQFDDNSKAIAGAAAAAHAANDPKMKPATNASEVAVRASENAFKTNTVAGHRVASEKHRVAASRNQGVFQHTGSQAHLQAYVAHSEMASVHDIAHDKVLRASRQ